MRFAARLDRIEPSMTLAMNARAQELRKEGVEVTSLAAGEPDFPTPEFVRKAAIEAIQENFTRYTPVAGIPELRAAAGRYFERHYGAQVGPECIIMGAGGKNCLYTFMQTVLNPGDEVLIPSPYWVSYPDMALLAGATPVLVPAGPESGYKVTSDMLEAKRTAATRLLVLNSPCNPTGAVYSESELAAIMRWALERRIFVLSDEIYDQLVYRPAKMASAISWFHEEPALVAVVNGLSKSFAMTGWRVGFLAGQPELIKKMSMLQGHSLSNICSIAQKAALAALTGPEECVEEMRAAFERRRDLAMKIISGWSRAICPRPAGAFYLFVDVAGYYGSGISNSVDFCAYLLEKAHVAAVPGAAFGDDRCFRIAYAVGDDTLERALLAIGNVLPA